MSTLLPPEQSAPLLTFSVKPIKLSRSKLTFLTGASVTTSYNEWKDDPKTHRGIPSTLEEIKDVEVRTGKDADGDYSEIVVPAHFEPGSILLFATDMDVGADSVM